MDKVFRFALSLMLLLQGLAFSSPALAQGKGSGERAAAMSPQQSNIRSVNPTSQPITVLPPVNMMALSDQAALAPQTSAPRELRPIHPPSGVSQQSSRVAIPKSVQDTALTPNAPPSTGVQSPPVSTSFRSDQLDLGSIPPDTMGAVGDNHVVTTTNEKVIIHDRNGLSLSNVTLDVFWATVLLGGNPPNTFDPKILYDRFNDRFIIVTQANSQALTSATLVAVSQTADPTGTWNRYAIDADAAATAAGGKWADYPSIGFNNNWISVQVNLFGYGTTVGYQGPAIYVINKAAAYNNTLSTVSTFEGSFATCLATLPALQGAELGCGFTMAPAITEDNTTATLYLTEDWDGTAAQLRISQITGSPAAPVLTVGTQFPQSLNSWRFNARIIGTSGGYVLQRQQNVYLLSGNRVTANDSRIQNTVLRNGSLWAVHHVMLPTVPTLAGTPASTVANPDNHTAIQWWQINPTLVDPGTGTLPIQRGRLEDPTADNCHNGSGGLRTGVSVPPCPAAQGQFFTFPNISVNQNNDVLIGYSRFSNLTLPKAAYSFRASGDAINTLRDSQTFREGVGNYNIGGGTPFNIRWGDYSSAMVDPVNDTDFWTIQEFADFQREIFGPGQFAGVWATWWAQIKPSSTTATAGNLIISEFRLRGPSGPRDEFVELYNPGNAPLTVTTTDGSDGWAVAFSANGTTITALASVPNGTTIPARGHYLVVNSVAAAGISPFSLNAYPNTQVRPSNGDAMYTPDLADNGGVAIFRTGLPANMNVATLMDSVGFAGLAAGLFKEGTGIPNIVGTPTGQISFHRNQASGTPKDTGDNAADFIFTNTVPTELLGSTPRLGAPGPENVDSPIHNTTGTMTVSSLDGSVGDAAAPNFVYDPTPVTNGAAGTITVRRRFINLTGSSLTKMRLRVVDGTIFPQPPGMADLRLLSSPNLTVETPAAQALGGGLNSSGSVAAVTLAAPLANGVATPVDLVFGVQQAGCFSFVVISETLPVGTNTVFGFRGTAGGGPCAPTAAPAKISGSVVTPDGEPVGGVTLRLTGAKSAIAITDSDGNYHFNNVETGQFYTVTPARVNYRFTPDNRSFSLSANKTDAVFTAVPEAVIAGNGIDTPEYFVRQHYLDFLGREPDESGFNFWSNQIASCGNDAACLESKRVNVSAAYFLSIEFQRTGGLVDGLYRLGYGRAPRYAEFVPDTAAISQNVVVGRVNWEEQLAANKRSFIQSFVNRDAFRTAFDGLSNEAYVDSLIGHAGVSFNSSERGALVNGLDGGTATRADVLLRIAENEGFVLAKRNATFVMMEYFGYLRRDPDEDGFQFWLRKLNQFDGNFERAEMVKAFINSTEYRSRFRR